MRWKDQIPTRKFDVGTGQTGLHLDDIDDDGG